MSKVTLIPGDGIGPEIIDSVKKVIKAVGVDIQWDEVNAGEAVFREEGVLIPDRVFESLEKNKIALKGPITTPVGHGFKSINVTLRQKYDLYTNLRPVETLVKGISKFDDIDIVIFRENTEGLYCGIEHQINDEIAEAIKVISKKGSDRIIKEAFDYARKYKRKKVTLVHKANIMKLTDGMFLKCGEAMAKEYPDIEFETVIVDNMCMQLVMYPEKYDVLVAPNLYGDILSDLCAGLVGGLGLIPGANIGDEMAIFEAVHGSAPDIAGKNFANPTAVLLSACMMLRYLGSDKEADKIEKAIKATVKKGIKTRDLNGTATTVEFTEAVIKELSCTGA